MILFNALGIRDSGGLRVLQLELGKYNEETYPGYILVCNDSEYLRQIIEDYKHVKNFKIIIHKASGLWSRLYYENVVFKKIVNKYDCIHLFTNDAVFLYLLKTKSCTKFYFVWSAGSIEKQKELIANFDKNKMIIANGPKDDWDIPLSKKLFLVKEYIDDNFYKQQTIEKWDILLSK